MLAFIQIIITVTGIAIITLSNNLLFAIIGALITLLGVFLQVLILPIGKRKITSSEPKIQFGSNIEYYLLKIGHGSRT